MNDHIDAWVDYVKGRDATEAALRVRIRELEATCTCAPYPVGDGPEDDCAVHGAVRALNEAMRERDAAVIRADAAEADVEHYRDRVVELEAAWSAERNALADENDHLVRAHARIAELEAENATPLADRDDTATIELAAVAIAGRRRRSEHSQLCPVWTDHAKDSPLDKCDCWILENARIDARAAAAVLVPATAGQARADLADARRPAVLDLGVDTCNTCREDRPVAWYYENGEAAICGECLEQELLERDRLRAALDDARRERDAWQELAEARSALLACYRTGKHPSEQLLRRLDAAKAAFPALSAGGGGPTRKGDSKSSVETSASGRAADTGEAAP